MSKLTDNLRGDFPGEYAKEAAAEIDRLAAIVDRLPKTADGVPATDGAELYHPKYSDNAMFGITAETRAKWIVGSGPDEGSHWIAGIEECYSTCAAAEAANNKQETQ